MASWLCPVKGRSWKMIKRTGVFGAPMQMAKTMQQVKIGDFLVFCLLSSVRGIVAVYRVVSDVYEDNSDVWGRGRYPIRVKVELVYDFLVSSGSVVPLSDVFGGNLGNDVVVEPFLKNVWIVKMAEEQFLRLSKLFETIS